jgi:long-chain acyl-CoA synthetase
MDARDPVDDFRPPWTDVPQFLALRPAHSPYLTELHHDRGTRRTWTSSEWATAVGATAQWLTQRGVQPGDAVATLAGNTAEALALAYACWALGACCVPLNPQESADRQRYVLRDARARLLVHSPEQAERAASVAGGIPLSVADLSLLDQAPTLPSGSLPGGSAVADGSAVAGGGLDWPALRLYTSGTTGEPKGIELTLGNIATDLDALQRVYGWDAATRVLTVLPIHHANALVISSLLAWASGASVVLCDRFRSERFWPDARAEGATTASLVPTLLEFLLATEGAPPAGFREVLCGAGPLLVDTATRFEDRFGLPVRHLYGLSETTCVCSAMPALNAEDRRHWHTTYGFPSIGTALPHAHMAVVDPDGTPLAAGKRGELVVRGAMVMRGYAGLPEATADAFRQGWFHTGDEGFWQPGPGGEPAYFITGRIKELIIRGGHNISPFEIDEVLRQHPRVRFALAVPFDHRLYGEEVAAYVVPEGELSEPELLDWCAQRLDFAHQPKVVVFGQEVPFTATGKAKRLELRRRLAPVLEMHRESEFRRSRLAARPV